MSTTANVLEGRLYRALHRTMQYGALGILWLLAAAPIVTAAPATAALFGVVRSWQRTDEPRVVRPFWRFFRENFLQAFLFGVIVMVVVVALGANVLLAPALPPLGAQALRIAAGLAAVLVLALSLWAIPMMVSFRMPLPRIIRSAAALALGRPLTSFVGVVVLTAAAGIVYLVPPAIIAVAPALATTVLRLCTRVFDQVATNVEAAA
jgi:uncharacterized membrane protein YesL